MMIYQFRILSDEVEDFSMDIEVPYNINLLSLNDFIGHTLGYNEALITSIFKSDSEWEKLQEYTQIDMNIAHNDLEYSLCDECDAPSAMDKFTVADVVTEKFDRLIYVFDHIQERQLYIELLRSIVAQDGVTYPRVVSKCGDAPLQLLPND